MALYPRRKIGFDSDEEGDSFSNKLAKIYQKSAPPIPVSSDEDFPTTPYAPPSNSENKSPSIGQQFKDLFRGESSTPIQKDEYGLSIPQRQKGSTLSNVLTVAMPALYSLLQGEGILPGMMAGSANLGKSREKSAQFDQKQYDTMRRAAEDKEYRRALDSLNQSKLGEQKRYHDIMGGVLKTKADVASRNADTAADKAAIPNDRDKFIDIGDRLKKGMPVNPGELDWYEKQDQIYKKQGTVSQNKSFDPNRLKAALGIGGGQ